MASHPGTTSSLVRPDVFAPPVGRTQGLGVPFRQSDLLVFPPVVDNTAGARTAAGGGGAKPAPTERFGTTDEDVGFGSVWFEKVHLLPRAKVEFGNIITQVEDDYEIFSACRDGTVTLTTITNNATPGVELPNISAPLSIPAMTSVLDPTTTGQTTTGLGTIVLLKVRALQDGLPTFDTDIVFATTKDDVALLVSGTRIVLFPFEYEAPVEEILEFGTDVIEAVDGKEQRISYRKQPRQLFRVLYQLEGNDRQRVQVLLMDWMDNVFGFPLWHEQLKLTAGVSSGATQYQVQGALDVDFRVGGLGVVFTDANTFDVLNISAVTDTLITADDPSVNAYPAGTPIMPLRTATINKVVDGRRSLVNLEQFAIEFRVTDNDTGAPTGSTSAWNPNTYLGRILLDECNVSNGDMQQQFTRRLFVIDNQSGLVKVRSPWDRFKRTHQKGFVARDRAEILSLRRLLLAVRGRQTAFFIPTFFEDLTVKADLTSGSATMDVENVEYGRFVGARRPKKVLRVTFTDDTTLVREVQSSIKVDPTTERLTLDTTWPANRTVAEIARVEFFELVRFATDRFALKYPRIALAELLAPVQAVFDDVP